MHIPPGRANRLGAAIESFSAEPHAGPRRLGPKNALPMHFNELERRSQLCRGTTIMMRKFCLAPLRALLLAGVLAPAWSQAAHDSTQEPADAPQEPETPGEPLDLSTPLPEPKAPATLRPTAPPAPGWEHRVGVDYTKPAIPATRYQPEALAAVPDQSTGAAWATLTGPLSLPGWDRTTVEARVDPAQGEGKVATTVRRSLPVGDQVVVTLENGMSVTQSLPHMTQVPRGWASSQALRLDLPPSATSVWLGADISSADEKWLRSLNAEQKLFGGPVSIKGSIRESASGDPSKSLSAAFKWTW